MRLAALFAERLASPAGLGNSPAALPPNRAAAEPQVHWWRQTEKQASLQIERLAAIPVLILILLKPHDLTGQPAKPPDLVIVNANIRTMVAENSRAGALAVSGNRITAVGTTKQMSKLIGRNTRVIDARGRLVLPGFNDAHVHFMGIGNIFSSLDLREVRTAGEMLDRIRRYVRVLPKGRWILGGGWNDGLWKLPDRHELDLAAPNNPVFLYHADAKSAFANTAAFERAGTKIVDTGVVSGAALSAIRAKVPEDHSRNWTELAETATNYAASLGVTSVQDMHSDDSREIYRELYRQGKLKTRIYDCIPLPDWRKLSGVRESDEMVRGGCLKSFSDGDDESRPRLLRDILPADKARLQVMIHAIGDRANRIVLDVFEEVAKLNPRRDRRHRIEHAHNPDLEDLGRFARSGIIPSMQPHLFDGGSGGYYRTLLDLKAGIAFGSDAAITDLDPVLGIHAAVNAGGHSISVYEAVRAYTMGSAYAEFREKDKGSIEVGKLADFVILSDDIFALPTSAVRNVLVISTFVDGREVYSRK